MDNENYSIEAENQQSAINSKYSNVFLADKPIGRMSFFKAMLSLTVVSFIVYLLISFIYYMIDTNHPEWTYLIWFLLIFAVFVITYLYLCFINYTKRLFDITGDKQRAIFYCSAIFIGVFASLFIPVVNIIGIISSIAIFLTLLFKKGKLV